MSNPDLTQQSNFPPIDSAIPWGATIMSPNKGEIEVGAAAISTGKLEISASVYSQFVYGEWLCTFDSTTIEDGIVAIGTKIRFRFRPNNSPVVDIFLSVLSIEISSVTDAQHVGTAFSFVLVSPWYFDQVSISRAYKGRMSDIIKQLVTDELGSSFSTPIEKTVIVSNENPESNRYRTEMTPSTFFEKRLRPHMRGNGDTAIFMYTNIKHEFEFIDYPAMVAKQSYTAIDFSHPHLNAFADKITNAKLTSFMIYPRSDHIKLNTKKERDLWALCNPALLYMYHLGGQTKTANDDPVLKWLSTNIDQRFTFVRKDVVPALQTKTYLDDSFHDYQDLYAEVLNDYNKRLIENQSIGMVCLPNINIDIGRLCTRYITKFQTNEVITAQFATTTKNEIPSLFKQDYIITEVSHVFRGIRGVSYVTLGVPAFKYTHKQDVTDLWAPP